MGWNCPQGVRHLLWMLKVLSRNTSPNPPKRIIFQNKANESKYNENGTNIINSRYNTKHKTYVVGRRSQEHSMAFALLLTQHSIILTWI
jgi:hypothetical protein